MVFIRLCEYHIEESENCAWVQKTIGELFVYCHDILSHKFIEKSNKISESSQDGSRVRKSRTVLSWTRKDLFDREGKYFQYLSYLFDKNLNEIIQTVNTIDKFYQVETKKYEEYGR